MAKADQLSPINSQPFQLLNHFFKLRAENIHSGRVRSCNKIATQRDVKPIPFFALYSEISQTLRVWRIPPGLRDHIYHQVPSPRLGYLRESARNRFRRLFCLLSSSDAPWNGNCTGRRGGKSAYISAG